MAQKKKKKNKNKNKNKKKKLSIGSWAYCFGPYEANPVPFDVVVQRLSQLKFDGVEIAGFRPHVHPDDYPMKRDRDELKAMLERDGLGVSGLAADFWHDPPPASEEAHANDHYVKLFKKNLQLCLDLGAPSIRVDTVSPPDAFPDPDERKRAFERIANLWNRCAQISQDFGVGLVWEFEPGFLFNKPSEVVAMVEAVGHPNFKVLFDTCHAYMCAVVGARQPEPKETLSGGVVEFARLLTGNIGHIHLIDSDGTLHDNETSTHRPFGEGFINFDEVIPAIQEAGYTGEWWTIDLCFWPQAWEVTEKAKDFLSKYLH